MFDWLLKKKSKTRIGIDLGSSAFKIVELGMKEGRPYLLNYAMAQAKNGELFKLGELKDNEVAGILKALLAEAKVTGRAANISLPVEETFTTVMEMPLLPEKELAAAIPFEGQRHIPVPMDEVVLDWSLVSGPAEPAKAPVDTIQKETGVVPGKTVQVLLVAVPKKIINRLTQIAKLAGLDLLALEQEAFSLTRSLVGNDSGAYMIVDMGSRSADLVVVDRGLIRLSHSVLKSDKELVLSEMERVVNLFQARYNKKVSQCLLAGGRSGESGTASLVETRLKIPTKLGQPFARIEHPPILNNTLNEIGILLSVATGLAMRE